MAITYVNAGTVEYPTGGTSATFTLSLSPAGFLVGDVLVFSVSTTSGSATTLTPPSGATAAFTPVAGPTGVNGGVYVYPIPGPTKPSTVTFTWPSAQRGTLAWVQLRGAHTSNPLDSSGIGDWSTDYVMSWSAPSFTTATDGAYLVGGAIVGGGSVTLSGPGGWTLRTDATQREGTMATKGLAATAGLQAGITFSEPTGLYGRAWQLAIRDAAAGSGPATIPGASTASLTNPADRWTKQTTRVSWRNQATGKWAAVLPTSSGHRLYADLSAPSAGTVVDNRQAARATVVHDAGWTGILRGHTSAARFSSYDADYAPLVVDASVPLAVSSLDQSPTALLRTSNGYLWAANLSSSQVNVSRSTDNGATWSSSVAVATGFTQVTGVVGLAESNGAVVLVASGNDSGGRAARSISMDASSIASGSWTTETLPALASGATSDDHGSICTAPDGRVLMVAKTTNGAANIQLIYLLVRSVGGVWTSHDIEVGPDDDSAAAPGYTRPGITVDGTNVVVTFASIYTPNSVWSRTAPLSDLSTWGARETVIAGPGYMDGAQTPEPWHVRAGGDQWPLLANNTDTDTIVLVWMESTNEAEPVVSHTVVGARSASSFKVRGKVSGESSARIKVGTDRWSLTTNGSTGTVDSDGYFESEVTGLTAGTRYWYAVEGLTTSLVTPAIGDVKTLPADGVASFTFAFGSCFDSLNGSLTGPVSGAFGRLAARRPDMTFHLGDFTYADNTSTSQSSHRGDLEQVVGYSATLRNVLSRSATTYVKSDHDAGGGNDAYPGAYTAPNRAAAKQVFPYPTLPATDGLYHAFTVGRVRFIFTDTRSYMSSGGTPTRLGATQKAWFKSELSRPEPVKVWVQEAAWIDNRTPDSPDDIWAFFSAERTELGNYWTASGVGELVTLHGDQHALSADDGSHNSWGGFASFCAAPFRNLTSLKTSSTTDWSEGFWPASVGGEEAQYGFCTVTDTGQQITLALRGYGTTDVVRVSMDVVVSAPPEVSASFTGSGSLTATASQGATRTAAFTGAGTLSAAVETAEAPQRTASFTGSGTLTATRAVAVTAGFTGSGSLSAVVSGAWARDAAFTGSGVLSASVTSRIARTAGFTGSGTLTATASVPGVVAAQFTGSGSLTAAVSSVAPLTVAADFTGLGSLTADVAAVYTFTVFTPPTVTERWPVSDRFFRRLTKRTGVTVLKFPDGLYRQFNEPSDEEIAAASVAYLGGHVHRVDDAEAAALVEAGYGEYLSTEEVFV